MNKNILIFIIILIIITGGALAWHFWPDEEPTVYEEKKEEEKERDEEEEEEIITLERGRVGEYYSASLSFDAGKNPSGLATLEPSLIEGKLPDGIRMEMPEIDQTMDYPSSAAALREQRISGTPTQHGEYIFTIRYLENPYYAKTYKLIIEL